VVWRSQSGNRRLSLRCVLQVGCTKGASENRYNA
jgi:hypothetical protein